ncbi:hypothetical protein JKP88DRAFT_227787 [Tribonema minus]|uniref:Secreted protein n=1 Tax=Tribonema minus TaxID=303371 RepID=A0A835YMM7_9STRA|nr:hypothetical protein JKP88DRAFT_227787 [Tribonema minus]
MCSGIHITMLLLPTLSGTLMRRNSLTAYPTCSRAHQCSAKKLAAADVCHWQILSTAALPSLLNTSERNRLSHATLL